MIDIDKAQKQITDDIACEIFDKDINREGVYLAFEDLKIQNHLNIDYIFSLYVALASFTKNRSVMYKRLNQALNEINQSSNIDLISCKPMKADGNLLIYRLQIETNIIGN
ncbi:hypothetical protein AAHK07_02125 [Aliarcobacter cryaerophilus]|jgi:hypothetical protein|uniref:hypothetical protein n=1 Tax=Aliarcobacter cryaerophilus TaxID=28198 RepID=UPI00317B4E1D